MGKFVISVRKDGQFQFNLKAANGQVVLTSEAYTTEAACRNGIASVKKHAVDKKFFVKKEAKNGKPYFNLLAANHQVIGSSQMYASIATCDKGIRSVMNNAPEAEIVYKQ